MKIMFDKIEKPNMQDILFFIAYGVFLIFGILSESFYYRYFSSIYSLIKYCCIGLLLIRELTIHKYSIKSLIIGVIFVGLIVITRSQSTLATITYTLIFLFCARNIDFKKIARFSAWTSLIVMAFVIGSSYLGIIEDYISYEETRVRHYLGFLYALRAPVILFNITGLFVYLKKTDIQWLSLLILAILNVWMLVMTGSRLSPILSILLILVDGFLKLCPDFFDKLHVVATVMIFSFVICFSVSMYFTVTYDSNVEWQQQLNTLLGGRLNLGKTSLEDNGVSMFGQEMKLIGNGLDQYGHKKTGTYNYVDSFYIQILQRYGILFTAIWILLLTYALYRYYKSGDYYMMVCLAFVAMHCVIDDLSLHLHFNTFWLAIAIVMNPPNKEDKTTKLKTQTTKNLSALDSEQDKNS